MSGQITTNPFSFLSFRIYAAGCLLGATATFYLLFGLAGYVHSAVLNLTTAGAVAICEIFFLYEFFSIPGKLNTVGRVVWSATFGILVAETLLSFLPPTARDELTHHLAMPRMYVRAGRIIEVPMAPYSYYPMLLDMLYTPWVYWGYDFVPKYIHGLFGWLTGLSLYAYLSRRMSPMYGALGFFFFASTPVIIRLSQWAYIDLGVTFYATGALLSLLLWREERHAYTWLALAALCSGFAFATKPTGLVTDVLLGGVFIIVAAPFIKKPASFVRASVIYIVLALLPCVPWMTKNWLQTANPVYPFLGGLFSTTATLMNESGSFAAVGIFDKRTLLYGESFWQLILLPLRVFLFGRDDNPQYFDGVLTPMLVLFLPWAFRGKWVEEKRILFGYSLLYLVAALFLADLRIRYILPIVPPLVIMFTYGVFNVYAGIKRPMYLFAALALFAFWHGSYGWVYFQKSRPFAYLQGSETREEFLMRALPEYPALQYINRELPENAKIYLLFLGRRAYYCERDYFHDAGELPGFLLGTIQKAQAPQQIKDSLASRHITHLLVREDLLVRFLKDNLTQLQSRTWNRFSAEYLKLAFRGGAYAVYSIDG